MEKENELKLYVLHRDYYSGVVHLLEDDKRKPCYIWKSTPKITEKRCETSCSLTKNSGKARRKRHRKAERQGSSRGWCTHNGRCNVCSHCLPVSWRFAAARSTRQTHVSTHCARVTQRRPRVHPRFRRRTSNVTFTDAGVRLIRRCVMQMAAWRNIRATVTGYCIVASWKMERSRFFFEKEKERKREREKGEGEFVEEFVNSYF